MPTYDYFCQTCQHSLETFQKMSDAHLEECPECHKPTLTRRPGGGIGLSFSGPGFYITDYHKKPAVNDPSQQAACCPCGKKSAVECKSDGG